jgi:hypothetical protein
MSHNPTISNVSFWLLPLWLTSILLHLMKTRLWIKVMIITRTFVKDDTSSFGWTMRSMIVCWAPGSPRCKNYANLLCWADKGAHRQRLFHSKRCPSGNQEQHSRLVKLRNMEMLIPIAMCHPCPDVPTVSLLSYSLCLHAFPTVVWPSLSMFEPQGRFDDGLRYDKQLHVRICTNDSPQSPSQ